MLFSALLWMTLALAQEPQLLSLPEGVPDLRKLSGAGAVSFPVVIAAQSAVELRLLEVRLGTEPLAGVPFAVTFSPAATGEVSELSIAVAETGPAGLLPGEYTLEILVLAAEQQSRLTLRVLVPAAELRVLPNPMILDVVKPVFGQKSRLSVRTFTVVELGHERGVRALSASPTGNAIGVTGTLGDALLGPIQAIELAAGGSGALTLDVLPTAPLGSNSVNLELRAPELAAPIPVPVELRVRRPAWLLLVAAFLGASMQLLQKMILPWVNTRHAEDEQVRKLRTYIDSEQSWKEATLYGELETARSQLPRLFSAAEPWTWPGRQEQLSQIREHIALAVGAFELRLAALQGRLDDLHALTSRRFQLPGPTRVALNLAATQHSAAQALLTARDVDGASAQLKEADAALTEALNSARRWSQAVVSELESIGEVPALLPSTTPNKLSNLHEATLAALKDNALTNDALVSASSVARAALEAIHAAKQMTKELTRGHRRNLIGAAERISSALLRQTDALEAFNKAWREPKPATDTLTDFRAVRESAGSLYYAVKGALAVLISEEIPKSTLILLQRGDYEGAIQAAMGRSVGSEGPDTFSESAGLGMEPGEAPAAEPPANRPGGARPQLPKASIAAPRSMIVSLIETMLSILLLGALVWTSYADKFVGTTEELLAIFAFAYGANLGLDPLLGQITGRIVKKEPASDTG